MSDILIPSHMRGAVRSFLREAEKKRREKIKIAALLDHGSDEQILRFFSRGHDPLGLACWYPKCSGLIKIYMPLSIFYDHPRCPVLMRGSVSAMVQKHAAGILCGYNTSPNGLCREIIIRYLKLIKHTCFDPRENYDFVHGLINKISRRHRTSYHLTSMLSFEMKLRGPADGDHRLIWFKGKQIWVTDHQHDYLQKLHTIVKKTDVLQERIEYLKAA